MDIVAILRSERDRVARQLEGLIAALAAFAGSYVGNVGGRASGRLRTSTRAGIAAAQGTRRAKLKGQKAVAFATSARKGKRTLSAAAKAKIAAAQRGEVG